MIITSYDAKLGAKLLDSFLSNIAIFVFKQGNNIQERFWMF